METRLNYYLQIADNAFILSHRLSEYCSKAPFLEEDLANTNVALDLLGLAESVYEEIAKLEGKGKSGDDIAFRRKEHEYLNVTLIEQPNTDFAHLTVRQFFMDAFNYYFFFELCNSKNEFLSALGKKSIKEVTYHLRRSSEWMIRLGKGTEEANTRMQNAINILWKYTPELFEETASDIEFKTNKQGVDLAVVKGNWQQKINEILYLGHFSHPENVDGIGTGKKGTHSEHFGYMLCDIQYLTNKYPDAVW